MDNFIRIIGARENNLKNVNLEIPRNKLVVFTGLSGSGKSSLAFDTIFAEGQRRYMESLSSYARQFLGQMKKPDVDQIDGLSPAIAIDQKTTSANPRSTVGTVTEIYDYFRLLYANIGIPYCVNCGTEINSMSVDQIVRLAMACDNGTKMMVIAPVARGKKGEYKDLIEDFRKKGYVRAKIDGQIVSLDDEIVLDKKKKHDIYVVIDRLIRTDNMAVRLGESIETALAISNGLVIINTDGEDKLYSSKHSCPNCGFSFDEISSRLFSFNTPIGACPECSGIGSKQIIEENALIKDWNLSLEEGAISTFGWGDYGFGGMYYRSVLDLFGCSMLTPIKDLPREVLDVLFYGTNGEKINMKTQNGSVFNAKFEGIIPNLYRRHENATSDFVRDEIEKYMVTKTCNACHGKRLNKQALSVKIDGKSIIDVTDMNVTGIRNWIENLKLTDREKAISAAIFKEINARLKFLVDVGLEYLTLSRTAATLSGGEAQRIRLASQIGSGLTGVLYVLDEPSIGLHPRDTSKLIGTLKHLRDLGNSVIVVEHDEETIKAADFVVDVGPKAGEHGGRIIATGTPDEIAKVENSYTGAFLSGKMSIPIPEKRRAMSDKTLEIIGAKQNNLKNINVKIPLGMFVAVTGVSGSGKSSLINEILYPALANKINKQSLEEGTYKEIRGTEFLDKVVVIDQSPIGRTPRSNPVTYTGVFSAIRELFASVPESKAKGYTSGRFSFNVKGGRCETCGGDGVLKIEMHFLPDVYVTCDECGGKRYNKNTLEVTYKGKNINDVLNMTIEEALEFFHNLPSIKNKLQTLYDVGLGYIHLGQPATTLSGGEAQRVKLATELSKRPTGKTIYILDEPTTGLHSYDVQKLVGILQRLTISGNSVVVIEHNLDLIKVADYIIDLGPEGGDNGGKIVVQGTPEQVANCEKSYTGIALKNILK
ncbi:MAG: excinuclease ABC subunit UvrA [Clostridia bacterium]|nr:excinuclease ABC subunit UvrA [Clostridia bacterium]